MLGPVYVGWRAAELAEGVCRTNRLRPAQVFGVDVVGGSDIVDSAPGDEFACVDHDLAEDPVARIRGAFADVLVVR